MEYIKFIQKTTVKDILQAIDRFNIPYDFKGDEDIQITGISNGLYGIDRTLCFIEEIKTPAQIQGIQNAIVLTNTEYQDEFKDFNLIKIEDARFVFIKLLSYYKSNGYLCTFTTSVHLWKGFISPNADIHPSAILEKDVIIEEGVIISAGCVIKNGTFVGKGTIVRENSTIGCDGIALYKAKNGELLRFPHIAGVYIAENVEIGAGCVIVRGTLSNTAIGRHTVIGNLSNIGHGVKIGEKVWMSVGSLIGGNCVIDNHTTIGLGVRLRDNLKIGENVSIGMGSVVTKSISPNVSVFGNPAKNLRGLTTGPKR